MFEIYMYFYVFYCLCYVKELSIDMLEGKVSDERDPKLNEEEDIIMEDSREEKWRNVCEYGKDKSKIRALR